MNFSENKIPLLICVVGTVLTVMGMPSMAEIAAQPAA